MVILGLFTPSGTRADGERPVSTRRADWLGYVTAASEQPARVFGAQLSAGRGTQQMMLDHRQRSMGAEGSRRLRPVGGGEYTDLQMPMSDELGCPNDGVPRVRQRGTARSVHRVDGDGEWFQCGHNCCTEDEGAHR
jgi:hypothetical protein